MKKKIGIIFLMLIIHFISLLLFQIISAEIGCIVDRLFLANYSNDNFEIPFSFYIIGEIFHFVFVFIIAVIIDFIKNIENYGKITISLFQILTIILCLPSLIFMTYVNSVLGFF